MSKAIKKILQQIKLERLHRNPYANPSKQLMKDRRQQTKSLIRRFEPSSLDKKLEDAYSDIVRRIQSLDFKESWLEVEDFKTKLSEIDETNNKWFHFVGVEILCYEMNISPNMFIISSAKNQGKSYQISKIIQHSGGEFFFVRNSQEEIDMIAQSQFASWPHLKMTAYPSQKRVYKEVVTSRRKNPRTKEIKEYTKKELAGYLSYCSGIGFRAAQGPSYPKVKSIIWDECNSNGGQYDFKLHDLERFEIFKSSVVREKKGVKTYLFFNKINVINAPSCSLVMDFYFILPDSICKYHKIITNLTYDGKDSSSYVLFLDITKFHPQVGISSQEGLFLAGRREDLDKNTFTLASEHIKSIYLFLNSKPIFGIIYEKDSEHKICYISSFTIPSKNYNQTLYIVKIEPFDPSQTYLFDKIYTFSEHISNAYSSSIISCLIRLIKQTKSQKIFSMMKKLLKANSIYYCNQETFSEFPLFVRYLEQTYSKSQNSSLNQKSFSI